MNISVDDRALGLARKVMDLVYGPLPLGGSVQLRAKIQDLFVEVLSTDQKGWEGIDWAKGCDPANSPVIPDGYCIMPLKLTAENGAKGALSGEFHISRRVTCHECGGEGCEDCGDQGNWDEEIPIGWDIIKLIYKAAVDVCSIAAAPQHGVGK